MKTSSLVPLGLLALDLLFAVPAARSQDEAPETPPAIAMGTAPVIYQGSERASVPFTLMSRGPLFDLATMAALLDVEITVGPLGESHRLILKDKEMRVGPDRAVTVVTNAEGSPQEPIFFSQPPIQRASGIHVPLDFLELAFGDEKGLDFTWNESTRALEVHRREVRTLEVSVNVIHQLATTVEIRFDAVPRYRVERLDGAIEIRLTADRIALPVDTSRIRSPFVTGVRVGADRIRIDLAADAGVAEPRLIRSPEVSLVIEAFRQAARRDETPDPLRRAARASSSGVRTIVIDPGHGGAETGAVGRGGTTEKELALTVSRSLKATLESRLPRVRVVLTRDRDEDIAHESRTAIANQNKADLFISIHFNSYYGRQATGAETYFLSREASDQIAAAVAAAENETARPSSPETDLQLILWDLAQTHHLAESQRFAGLVQEELNAALKLRNRGVKQAPFRVLMGATMPAVLVELGFISNPEQESLLRTPVYQAQLVEALFQAIRRFKTLVEQDPRSSAPTPDRGVSSGGRGTSGREQRP